MKDGPKTIKYGRCFRLKLTNDIKLKYLNLNIYKFGFKAVEYGWLNNVQITSIMRLLKIIIKKKFKIKLNCSLIIPITLKPLETRMGSGKGERKLWKCPIKKGMIIFEFFYLNEDEIDYIFKIIKNRLPFLIKKVKILY